MAHDLQLALGRRQGVAAGSGLFGRKGHQVVERMKHLARHGLQLILERLLDLQLDLGSSVLSGVVRLADAGLEQRNVGASRVIAAMVLPFSSRGHSRMIDWHPSRSWTCVRRRDRLTHRRIFTLVLPTSASASALWGKSTCFSTPAVSQIVAPVANHRSKRTASKFLAGR